MTIFQQGPSLWRAKITTTLPTGKVQTKWFQAKTKAAAKAKAQKYLETRNLLSVDPDITVSKLCRVYLDRCQQNGLRPNTQRLYETFTNVHIVPAIGHIVLADLRPQHVEALMAQMDTSRQTKLLCRAFLRAAINKTAIKEGIVSRNVAALADCPKPTPSTPRSRLSPEDLPKILDAEISDVRRTLFLTIATTGLRISEALNLTWNEIEEREDGAWICLSQSKTTAGLQAIPVPAATYAAILALGKKSVCVFPCESGRPITLSNLRRAWMRTLKAASVPYTNPYQLRHLFGSTYAKTTSDTVLKRLMRHTDARTSRQYYAHAVDKELRQVIEK